ncbi:Na(+)/H(+) antiporter subunit B [Oceanobacillus bengalensis]|uniref:Na(+)/H(+) antiporter subunit B n=1 Tax=Oceanobacillus bengalensis TaxID=1435466 RepID=A0A494Z456_9BACI|nr:Na(+)/H(+) antiporter subunit B [Oceanobacillus bengalensis]RKQ17277.1 Na(+)/H(+) antiporter subunit B [Oceanobacillus bengalensis]
MYKQNNLILRTTTSLIAFLLLGFALYLLFAGHNDPGGGFVGGLLTSGAILLLYMAYGIEAMKKMLPFDFKVLIPIGLTTAVLTSAGSFLFGVPFLSHTFGYFQFPIFGEVELATAMLFDFGVYFTVVGVVMTIIITIAEDQ